MNYYKQTFCMIFLLVVLLSLQSVLAGEKGKKKKIVIHVPVQKKVEKHTHTIVKHIHHHHKQMPIVLKEEKKIIHEEHLQPNVQKEHHHHYHKDQLVPHVAAHPVVAPTHHYEQPEVQQSHEAHQSHNVYQTPSSAAPRQSGHRYHHHYDKSKKTSHSDNFDDSLEMHQHEHHHHENHHHENHYHEKNHHKKPYLDDSDEEPEIEEEHIHHHHNYVLKDGDASRFDGNIKYENIK